MQNQKYLLLILVLVGISASVAASEPSCKENDREFGNRTLNQLHCFIENPPGPVTVKLPTGEKISLSSEDIVYQEQAFLKSVLGMELEAEIGFDKKEAQHVKESSLKAKVYDSEYLIEADALTTITNLARSTSVVMLNEAHHVSKHRIFALELARRLRKQGFTHIAAETFYDVNSMMELGFPTTDNGAYINDPEFGHFIRQSMQMGYSLVEYESLSENRELEQAKNLQKFLNENPKAKILIYAGYSHIRERPEKRMMASILKKITQIDPLTIDQVGGTPRHSSDLADINYDYIKDKISTSPTVFKNKCDGNWLVSEHYSSDVDITVFHEKQYLKNGRINWLTSSPERVEYKKLLGNLKFDEPYVVKAVLENEFQTVGEKAIPVDQVKVPNDAQYVSLYMPTGNYLIFLERIGHKDVLLERIKVGETVTKFVSPP